MNTLELRYRRLLALYPAMHQRRYRDEMLGTLMEGAAPAQRWPRLREAADLGWNALLLRLNRRGLPRGQDARWATAAGMFGVLGALAMFAITITTQARGFYWDVPGPLPREIAFSLAWLAVALLAIASWHRVAAVAAWATALPLVVQELLGYPDNPPQLVSLWPRLTLALLTAACLSRHPTQRITATLGWRLTLVTLTAFLAASAAPWLDLAIITRVETGRNTVMFDRWGGNFPIMPGHDRTGALPLLIYAAVLGVLVRVLVKSGSELRRRLLVLTAAPIAIYLVIDILYAGFAQRSIWPTPVMLTIGQWIGLVLVPLIVLTAGVVWVRRLDDRQQLIELGRATRLGQRESEVRESGAG